jgi:hypothetical protein
MKNCLIAVIIVFMVIANQSQAAYSPPVAL